MSDTLPLQVVRPQAIAAATRSTPSGMIPPLPDGAGALTCESPRRTGAVELRESHAIRTHRLWGRPQRVGHADGHREQQDAVLQGGRRAPSATRRLRGPRRFPPRRHASGAGAANAPLRLSAPATAYGSQRQPSRWSGSRTGWPPVKLAARPVVTWSKRAGSSPSTSTAPAAQLPARPMLTSPSGPVRVSRASVRRVPYVPPGSAVRRPVLRRLAVIRVFDAGDVRLVFDYLEANERARLAEHEAYERLCEEEETE